MSNQITLWSAVLPEKWTVTLLEHKFTAFDRIIIMITTACHWILLWARPIQSTSLLQNHFYIILPSMPRSPKWSLLFRFYNENTVCTSHFFHKCLMPHQSHAIFFDLITTENIINLLVMVFKLTLFKRMARISMKSR